MANTHNDIFATYLRDHHAGSVAAREMLARAIEEAPSSEAAEFFTDLDRDIAHDQRQLENLITQLGATESEWKKAGAWIAEKFSRLKIGSGDASDPLRQLEFLETLLLGVRGKLALWDALAALKDTAPMSDDHLSDLQARAREQIERIDARRVDTFVRAFRSL